MSALRVRMGLPGQKQVVHLLPEVQDERKGQPRGATMTRKEDLYEEAMKTGRTPPRSWRTSAKTPPTCGLSWWTTTPR